MKGKLQIKKIIAMLIIGLFMTMPFITSCYEDTTITAPNDTVFVEIVVTDTIRIPIIDSTGTTRSAEILLFWTGQSITLVRNDQGAVLEWAVYMIVNTLNYSDLSLHNFQIDLYSFEGQENFNYVTYDIGYPTEDKIINEYTYPYPYDPLEWLGKSANGYVSTKSINALLYPRLFFIIAYRYDLFNKETIYESKRFVLEPQ